MTKALEIHDLAETGRLQLVCRDDDDVRQAPSVEFTHPVSDFDQQEIEWYFREYLDRPAIFGFDDRSGGMALWFAVEAERLGRGI